MNLNFELLNFKFELANLRTFLKLRTSPYRFPEPKMLLRNVMHFWVSTCQIRHAARWLCYNCKDAYNVLFSFTEYLFTEPLSFHCSSTSSQVWNVEMLGLGWPCRLLHVVGSLFQQPNEETLLAAHNLACALNCVLEVSEAKSVAGEHLPVARRALGALPRDAARREIFVGLECRSRSSAQLHRATARPLPQEVQRTATPSPRIVTNSHQK